MSPLFATLALAAPPSQVDLVGTWALHIAVVTENKLPIVGAMRSTGDTFVLARLQQADGQLVQEHVVCGGVVGGGLVKTKLPPAYLSSVPAKSYAVTTHPTGAGLRFQADLGTYRAGFDPTCPTVPTEATDPCVTDWDGDGAPGATIQVKIPMYAWTDVYVCQQNHILLDGVATSADRVEGGLEILDLQNSVIGATRSLFARSPSSTVVQSASTFTMTRLATDAGCEQVLAIR